MSNEPTTDRGAGRPEETKPKPEHKSFSIHIDRALFKVEQETITGAELRSLPTPPVSASRDLFRIVPGGLDVLVDDADVVELKEGLHFITAPRDVTPGASHGR